MLRAEPETEESPNGGYSSPPILLVEEERAVPVVTREALGLRDSHGLEANGPLAAAHMIRWPPRLLLTDVVMLA
jgi:CheY-like chemotaxis protein